MRTIVAAVVSAWLFLVLELATIAVLHQGALTTAWELDMGALWLSPSAASAAVPCALAGATLFAALALGHRAGRSLFTILLGASAATVAFFVTTGRHFAAPVARGAAVLVVTAVTAVLAWTVAPALSRSLATRRRAFAVGAGAVALALALVDRFVLVRLYPPFHVALAVATLGAAAVTGCALRAEPGAGASRRDALALGLVLAITSGALAAARPFAARLARFDNFRLLLVEHAPVLGQAVALAALLEPPETLADEGEAHDAPPHGAGESARGPSFEGRDIVLVTIDALRADHLGAYGYARPTTPAIDALARESLVFEHAYCPTPHTSYSVTSMMTGKYMRPLLLQGAGDDSQTLATFLRTYGYKTAAFYPPAVFFIDQARFAHFEQSHFGFEFRKVEFIEGEGRVQQVRSYLDAAPSDRRLFLWVHSFAPHEPYEAHPEHAFGDRDVDRYDSEIASADATIGSVVNLIRTRRPGAIVILTADHGEEFGEHGGRYHGTTVYEEQVRVPLLVSAPGLLRPGRVNEVVQTIDIVPTILSALAIPPSPRIRGRDLGPLLIGARKEEPGFAFVETEDSALLAEGNDRLICARKLGACRLYDVGTDPAERIDRATVDAPRLQVLRTELQNLGASHGRFELQGLRAETGKGWPAPILRAMAGDADAATDLAGLLDDSDRDIRRKAAELLLSLRRGETAPALRLSLSRDEDPIVKKWAALALTRLGETAPLTADLLTDPDPAWRRWASLVLAETGDARGEGTLIDWWLHGAADDYARALEILGAFGRIRSKDAIYPLVHSLGNVRLRPRIAQTLAAIDDDAARGPLVAALMDERYQTARIAISDALVALGAKDELARPLIRFLGVPDPLPGGVGYALRAHVLAQVGGPDTKGLKRLTEQAGVGVRLELAVPRGGNGDGTRVVVRATARGSGGEVRIGKPESALTYNSKGEAINKREAPRIHPRDFVSIHIPGTTTPVEIAASLPAALGVRPGRPAELILFAERNVTVEAIAVVPLADELPPPPPERWTRQDAAETDEPSSGAAP